MRLLFLPGSGGHGEFWAPVAVRLRDRLAEHGVPSDAELVDWPGLGRIPADPGVRSYDDLVDRVLARLRAAGGPSVLVAQSMGGYVAVRAALAEPALVSHLVLAATSGGVDVARFGATDWRPGALDERPDTPAWAFAATPDLSAHVHAITVPVLLVWATADPISPIAVGRHLAASFPDARLLVLDSDDHWVARLHADEVASAIADLLVAAGAEGTPRPADP